MLYTIGFDEVIRNLFVLSGRFAQEPIHTTGDLKKAYLLFLRDFQPTVPPPSSQEIFVLNLEEEEKLVHHFLKPSIIKDRGVEFAPKSSLEEEGAPQDKNDLTEKETKKEAIIQALDHLKGLNEDFHDLFELAIHSIFFRDSGKSIGGSVASAIGVIWANVQKEWTCVDTIEFLVHELIHNLIFLDELRYTHYQDYKKLRDQENFVTSAILKEPRPLDKVIHSIIVTTEILWSRLNFLPPLETPKVHFPNLKLVEKLKNSMEDVRNLKNLDQLLTPRGFFLLEKCESLLKSSLPALQTKNDNG
jgi:hypothetical protein